MTKFTKTIAKGGIATAAVGAMALAGATPANAQYRDRDDGISVGEVIAGAVILGGIAAVASAASKNRGGYDYRDGQYYGYDGYRGNNRYGYRGNPRNAVQQCVNAASQDARRYGYRYARVTDVRDVDDTRYGWRVKGRIEVNGERGYYNRYDRYDRYDRRDRYNSSDEGKFTCYIERGRVTNLDFSGVRGLR